MSHAIANGTPMLEMLEGFSAFAGLSRDDLHILASRAELHTVNRFDVLFRRGEHDPWMYCLLQGKLALRAADGKEHRVESGSGAAGKLLGRLKPRQFTATALTPVTVVRIDGSGMGYWHSAVDLTTVQVDSITDTEYLEQTAAREPAARLGADDFTLPSLPAIAMRARELIDHDECDAETLARIIIGDPPIAAKLIRAANSPVFYGTERVSTCERAIVRLGLKTTRQLVLAFAVRELFNNDAPEFAELVKLLWDHSAEVAAIAFVLARRTRAFDPGEAQLGGLLHDIGVVPVLHGATQHPGLVHDTEAVMAMAARQRAKLGRRVLQSWNFPPSLVSAAADSENWWRDASPQAELADLVVVAQLLSFIGKNRIVDVPPVVSVPAFRKVLGEDFDAGAAMVLLGEAGDQIAEVRRLLHA